MATIQILNRKTLADKVYPLQYISFQKPDNNGKLHPQENEVYFRPNAVAVLLIDEKAGQFLLARQFRLPTFLNGSDSGYLLETFAGLINESETPEQAAVREVKEEAGYDIDVPKKVGAVYTSAGGVTEYLHLYISAIDLNAPKEEGGGVELEGEDIELQAVSIAEVKEQLAQGSIRDAKTMILLQHYFLNGLG